MVVSQALGGGKSTPGASSNDGAKDVTAGAQSVDQAVAAINQMFSV